jgi:hypothetical protein
MPDVIEAHWGAQPGTHSALPGSVRSKKMCGYEIPLARQPCLIRVVHDSLAGTAPLLAASVGSACELVSLVDQLLGPLE